MSNLSLNYHLRNIESEHHNFGGFAFRTYLVTFVSQQYFLFGQSIAEAETHQWIHTIGIPLLSKHVPVVEAHLGVTPSLLRTTILLNNKPLA